MMSGPEKQHYTDGWGVSVTSRARTGHHWKLNGAEYQAKCGVRSPLRAWNGQNSLFALGTYPKCKRCVEALLRR